jgi:hypothetical protein
MGRKTTFKRTVFAHAVLLAIAATVSTGAMAQSNTTGNIYGQAAAGSTSIVIENLGTGAKRTLTPDASGRFQAPSMPAGQYKVQLMNGTSVTGTSQVEVLIGQGTEVVFTSGTQLSSVQVVGARRSIDVSSSNNGASFTAKQLDALPIQNNVGAIIQLAPNTTRGDTRYNGAASFGGGAPSENSFYINGFPVTNPLTQLGSSELPFGAIAQAQILTGGFGAEFGRSIGGVVNIQTKSGTNEWEAGVSTSWSPASLRARPNNIYYEKTGDPANAATDGGLYRQRDSNTQGGTSVGAYIGGPLVKDKLFMFMAVQSDDTTSSGVQPGPGNTSGIKTGDVGKWGWYDTKDNTTRYLGKFDWNLSDDHRLELTVIGDKSKRNEQLSGYDYATQRKTTGTNFTGDYVNLAGDTQGVGMEAQILKYTGNLTDDLTLSALVGVSRSPHSNTFTSATGGGSGPLFFTSLLTPTAQAPGVSYPNPQARSTNQIPDGAEDVVQSKRLDVEWKVGAHTLRAGLDDNKLSSYNAGDFFPGGGVYSYRFTSSGTFKPCAGPCANYGAVKSYTGTLGANGYYARERIFFDYTNAFSDQSAQYIEDRYQVNKDLLLTIGLRNESFANKNNLGETFLEQKNVLSPRFGAAWDVNGDSSMKVFGSLGRYAVQIPTHLAVRGAGPSTYLQQFFTYTGIDANGAPIGRTNISAQHSPDGELGQAKDPNVLSALGMKPNQQDEITLGFEKAYSKSLNFGAKATFRKLLATIDDYCDETPFYAYADKNGINTDNYSFVCVNHNPGLSNTFNVDYSGTGKNYTQVTLSAKDMGFDTVPAERTYVAVDLFLEHPLSNGWYGKVNYTWSKNYGSTEGQTKSDIGQTDVAATQSWDMGDLMTNSYGPLPNDRTHQLKAYGYYELTKEWSIGGNLLIASGRPMNCIGSHPNPDSPAQGYGSSTFFCNGVAAPRGSVGNLPTDKRLDVNFAYRPESVKGLGFKVDIFNLFNEQTVQVIDETYNTGGVGTPIISTYGRVISYTNPRQVKLSAEYKYKF